MDSTKDRKFKVWDSKVLTLSYEQVLQIKTRIENACIESGIEPTDLPMSAVPSHILYDISVCYLALYQKTLENDLISSGYPSKLTNTIH